LTQDSKNGRWAMENGKCKMKNAKWKMVSLEISLDDKWSMLTTRNKPVSVYTSQA
jgi:hypothetical protein